MRKIAQAEIFNEKISFDTDIRQIEKFRKKYNSTFELIKAKGYVDGEIIQFSELTLTKRGKFVFIKYKEKIDNKKRSIFIMINSIVSAAIGGLITWLIMKFT